MRGPIVVGTDGSETSRLAIAEAASIAKGTGQTVVVVFVRHAPLAEFSPLGVMGNGSAVAEDALNANQALAEAQSIAILERAPVGWRFDVRLGDPAAELIRAATEFEADTIVVAGRRHGRLGSIAHRSVCTHLLHQWPGSLLVIHPPTDTLGADAARTAVPGL
jgi:nucleotide-binding universal stress UspA family protein